MTAQTPPDTATANNTRAHCHELAREFAIALLANPSIERLLGVNNMNSTTGEKLAHVAAELARGYLTHEPISGKKE